MSILYKVIKGVFDFDLYFLKEIYLLKKQTAQVLFPSRDVFKILLVKVSTVDKEKLI